MFPTSIPSALPAWWHPPLALGLGVFGIGLEMVCWQCRTHASHSFDSFRVYFRLFHSGTAPPNDLNWQTVEVSRNATRPRRRARSAQAPCRRTKLCGARSCFPYRCITSSSGSRYHPFPCVACSCPCRCFACSCPFRCFASCRECYCVSVSRIFDETKQNKVQYCFLCLDLSSPVFEYSPYSCSLSTVRSA